MDMDCYYPILWRKKLSPKEQLAHSYISHLSSPLFSVLLLKPFLKGEACMYLSLTYSLTQ